MSIEIIELDTIDSEEIQNFVSACEEDVEQIFPHFDLDECLLGSGYKLMSDNKMVGLFIYLSKGLEAHVELDYLLPEYQDQGIGKEFLLEKIDDFRKEGYEQIISLTNNQRHKEYLGSLGFKQSEKHPDRFFFAL